MPAYSEHSRVDISLVGVSINTEQLTPEKLIGLDILIDCLTSALNDSCKRYARVAVKRQKPQAPTPQSVTAKREKSQTPKVLTAILTLPNLT